MHSNLACGDFSGYAGEIHPRILVIDDEPLIRWSLVAGLRHAGFAAIDAGTPEEARQLACDLRPEVVLFDVRLWNTDPARLIQEIRGLSPRCRIVILAVEGEDLTRPAWRGIEVIRKPFDLDAVVALVEQVLPQPAAPGARMAV